MKYKKNIVVTQFVSHDCLNSVTVCVEFFLLHDVCSKEEKNVLFSQSTFISTWPPPKPAAPPPGRRLPFAFTLAYSKFC